MDYKEFTDQRSNQVEALYCEPSTLLSSYFLTSFLKFMRKKGRKKKTIPTLPHKASPRTHNLCHGPMGPFVTAVLRHQCSSHKHPLKSVVLLRAACSQLLIFAPSVTQLILGKHLLFSGIYKYLPQFSLLITKSVTKAYSTVFTNPIQIHGCSVTARAITQSCSQLFSFSHIKVCSCRCPKHSVIRSLWVGGSAERDQFFLWRNFILFPKENAPPVTFSHTGKDNCNQKLLNEWVNLQCNCLTRGGRAN